MTTDRHPAQILQRSFLILAVATAFLYLALAGVTLWARHISVQNKQALCALRSDLQSQVAGGTKFLVDHPQGIPGIRPNLIVVRISSEQATIHAFRFLNC